MFPRFKLVVVAVLLYHRSKFDSREESKERRMQSSVCAAATPDEAPFFAVVLDVLGQFCDVSFIIVQTHCGLLLSVGTSLFRLKKHREVRIYFV